MPIWFSLVTRIIGVCLQNQRNNKWSLALLSLQNVVNARYPHSKASRGMYKSMSKAELRRMAKTKRKGKPTKKKRR